MQTKTFRPGRHSRPIEKRVDVKNIRDWMPSEAKDLIDIRKAWEIIARHYCGAVVGRGVCPIDCQRCRDEIIDLFRLEKAVSPPALLTWLAKDHAARVIERFISQQKAEEGLPALETELFPSRRADINLFEELLKQYESETAFR